MITVTYFPIFFLFTGWGPRSLMDLDYVKCCLCNQYTRDKEEHRKNHCEGQFILNYKEEALQKHELFWHYRDPTYTPERIREIEAEYADVANRRFQSHPWSLLRQAELEIERGKVIKEVEAKAKKAWVQSRKDLRKENARIRANNRAFKKRQDEGDAAHRQFEKFADESKVIAKERRLQSKRTIVHDGDQNEPKTKNVKTQTPISFNDEEESLPSNQTRITQFFQPMQSNTCLNNDVLGSRRIEVNPSK